MKKKDQFSREAIFAGEFYPKSKTELEKTVKDFLKKFPKKSKNRIFGLIVPHAGYEFSGEVAAAGFSELQGEDVETVVLIGNSHYMEFDGISVFPRGYFETPLGKVEVDALLAEQIMRKSERIFFEEISQRMEHSLEVQIPFLQIVLKKFKILPLLFGNKEKNDFRILSNILFEIYQRKKIFLISSSDLSHYPPLSYAEFADKMTIEAILSGKVEKFEQTLAKLETKKIPGALVFACSQDAIKTILDFSMKVEGREIKLLKYSAKGEDGKSVVGYAAIGFFKRT